MATCVHDKVCREYMRRYRKILCASCPDKCPYFEEKRTDKITLTARQLGEAMIDAYQYAGRYQGGLR